MTLHDDETLMRRVDGELTPDQGAAIDAAAAKDPALAARLQALRALRSGLRGAFPARADPRDQALAALIATAAPKTASPFAGLGDRLREAFSLRLAPVWAGVAAACFVIGLLIGDLGGEASSGLALADNARIADAGLVRVLDTGLAADGPDARGRSVGLTFQTGGGAWCRTFVDEAAVVDGLACRRNGGWTVVALAPHARPVGELRTAAAQTPLNILAAVDAMIEGETLDAAAETRARDAGWPSPPRE